MLEFDKILKFKKSFHWFALLFLVTSFYISEANVKIIYPTSQDTVLTNRNINIRWLNDNLLTKTSLYYSTNQGLEWKIIGEEMSGDNVNWTVPLFDTLSLQIKASSTFSEIPVLLWEISDAHGDAIRSSQISGNGKYVMSAGEDAKIKIWDIFTKVLIDSLYLNSPFRNIEQAMFFHNSDSVLIAADSSLILWDRLNRNANEFGKGIFTSRVRACAVHPDKVLIAGASQGGYVKIFAGDGTIVSDINTNNVAGLYSVSFSNDGNFLAVAGYSGDMYFYDWKQNLLLNNINSIDRAGGSVIWSLNYSPDDKNIATGGTQKVLKVWDVNNSNLIDSFFVNTVNFFIRSVRYHPLSPILMSGFQDGIIRQWDLQTKTEATVPIVHTGGVLSCGYSPTGDTIVSAGAGKSVRLWKNFKNFKYADSLDCIIKYPLALKLPNVISKTNEIIYIPVEVENEQQATHVIASTYKADVKIEIPRMLLDIQSPVAGNQNFSMTDTISFQINDVKLKDTVADIFALTLQSSIIRGLMKILDFTLIGNSEFVIEKKDGSVEVTGFCIGNTQRDISFSETGAYILSVPNPAQDNVEIKCNHLEDGQCNITLIDINGTIVKNIFKIPFLKHGIYSYKINTTDLSQGIYFIKYQSTSEILIKKFFIIRL